MNKTYSGLHNHTGDSNMSLGFGDSSQKLETLIIKAKEKGLHSIAITEHEILSNHVEIEKLQKKHNFKIIRGNEIYLVTKEQYEILKSTEYTSKEHYFPHFILLATDEIGHEYLRKLSSRAWEKNSFLKSGIMRRPTLMSDLYEVIEEKGHLIASSSCIGGQIGKYFANDRPIEWNIEFIEEIKYIFGNDNFYLEMQPPLEKDNLQDRFNNYLIKLSKITNTEMIITTDAHYSGKELWELHKAFLLADRGKNDEDNIERLREIYGTAYLMDYEELKDYFMKVDFPLDEFEKAMENTIKISVKCKKYTLLKKQDVPVIKYEKYKVKEITDVLPNTGTFKTILEGNNKANKYLLWRIAKGLLLRKKYLLDYDISIKRIDYELQVMLEVSEIIQQSLTNYFITMEKIIEIIWDKNKGNSIIGAGRGSIGASDVAFALGIIQESPTNIQIMTGVELSVYRLMDKQRPELSDWSHYDTQSYLVAI